MGSLDDAMHAAERRGGHRSQIDIVLEQLDADDATKLRDVYLPDRRYSAPQIARALAAIGHQVSRHAISDWRAKHAAR